MNWEVTDDFGGLTFHTSPHSLGTINNSIVTGYFSEGKQKILWGIYAAEGRSVGGQNTRKGKVTYCNYTLLLF